MALYEPPEIIYSAIRAHKGGAPKAPKPPKPPAPTQAAENYSASDINMRQRRAHGYSSTIIGGYDQMATDRPGSLLKSLLGQ